MFLLWLAVFIGFSGLGGLSTGGEMLIVARFVTGASAGFLTPASLSIITTSFVGGDVRNRALLIYGAAGAAGFSLGMVAGGLLTTAGWRWVFFAPVLFVSLLLILAVRTLTEARAEATDAGPPVRARPARGQFDLGGAGRPWRPAWRCSSPASTPPSPPRSRHCRCDGSATWR